MAFWGPRQSAQLGFFNSDKSDEIGFYVIWGGKPAAFYRVKISLANPEGLTKEAQFSVTWDPPQSASFSQLVRIPKRFLDLLESNEKARALITLTGYRIDHTSVSATYDLEKVKKLYKAKGTKAPQLEQRLPLVDEDVPVIAALDFDELQVRKGKLIRLAEEAKAKQKPPAPPVVSPDAKPAAVTVTVSASDEKTKPEVPAPNKPE